MKSNSLRLIVIVVAATAMVLVLAACGPQAAATPTDEPVVAETTEVVPTEEVEEAEPTEEPTEAEATPTIEEVATDEATTGESVSQSATVTCTLLNLNTVTGDELLSTIPDFSSRMVREFQEYRPYVSIQEFEREIGKYVSEDQVTAWEAYVYVPVAYNDSDAATLQQIPGVDEALAQTLVDGRPYADQQAFLDALAASLTADQVAQAACYLAAE
ncbi:MAG: hypothetical protein KC615_03065 [Anaerolineae bacterium]|nr:hypothetical protein [Anaerolineae bacterium]